MKGVTVFLMKDVREIQMKDVTATGERMRTLLRVHLQASGIIILCRLIFLVKSINVIPRKVYIII